MRKLRYGELTNLIFEAMAKVFLEMGSMSLGRGNVFTMAGKIIKLILEEKRKKVKKGEIKRRLKQLAKRKILSIQEKKGQTYVFLKKEGKLELIKHSLKLLFGFNKKNKQWDGHWFIVFFDIPERERRKRDYLRKLLRYFGFYQYQKSVYIFPYDCEREIALVKKIVEGERYIKYIMATKVEEEKKIKRYFGL